MVLELAAAFAACSENSSAFDDTSLEDELRSVVEAGRSAWPDVALDETTFVRFLAERTGGDRSALRSLHIADSYVACACREGLEPAIRSFSRVYLSRVPEFLARMRPTGDFSEEVRQILSEKLLVPREGSPPKIGDYSGRGSLSAWLRVAAVRTAINLRQQPRHEPEESGASVAAILATRTSPELDYMRKRYGAELASALRKAFAALSPDQRLVLHLHFSRGLTGDQIAGTLQIHRATVVRWIRGAREDVLRETSKYLREHLKISASERDSLVGILKSHVEMSLSQLLDVPAN
jgi:RNA polymerase sigma-70 factor, ECF subfamily